MSEPCHPLNPNSSLLVNNTHYYYTVHYTYHWYSITPLLTQTIYKS
jgi:hypothetical protein